AVHRPCASKWGLTPFFFRRANERRSQSRPAPTARREARHRPRAAPGTDRRHRPDRRRLRLRLALHRLRAQLDGPRHRGANRRGLARGGRDADRAGPGFEHWHASRMLDNGAQGIVFPHVDTASDAQRVANACRYPPVGKRSMGGGLQQLGFASLPLAEAARIVNEETLVVVMIESPQGVAQCEEIAAVKGVDALLIGTNDLCFEMGMPGQFSDPRVAEAYKKVI